GVRGLLYNEEREGRRPVTEPEPKPEGTVRPILRYDVPGEAEVLRRRAEPGGRVTRSIAALIDDLPATMYDAQGVGPAAPQIGVSRRVIVVEIGRAACR